VKAHLQEQIMRFFIAAFTVAFLLVAADNDVRGKGKPAGVGQKGGQQKGGQQVGAQQHGQAQFNLLLVQLRQAYNQGNPAQIQAAQQSLQLFLAQQQGMNQQGKGKGKGKG